MSNIRLPDLRPGNEPQRGSADPRAPVHTPFNLVIGPGQGILQKNITVSLNINLLLPDEVRRGDNVSEDHIAIIQNDVRRLRNDVDVLMADVQQLRCNIDKVSNKLFAT